MTVIDEVQRLAAVEIIVKNLERRLYGNGQPGDIADIKLKLDQLRSWYWKAIGALAALGLLATPLVQLLKYLLPPPR